MQSLKRFTCLTLLCGIAAAAVTNQPLPAQAFADRRAIATDAAQVAPGKKVKDHDGVVSTAETPNPVLWHQPANIAGLDLFYGQGGKDKQPTPPFVFEAEDKNGTNPKMDVRDADGKKWRVKTGEEARPEVVASRLLWAMGFYANDDFLLQKATVSDVKMSRGPKDVKAGDVTDARFSRKPGGQSKIGIWEWKTNPFSGTREFNGLRVMMAVMNNWDLKDVNNSVYADAKSNQQIFIVNDVGATFGANGVGWTRARSKGNIDSFRDSKFVSKQTATAVDFATPSAPLGVFLVSGGTTVKSYAMRAGLDWIGKDIPLADARWMGSMLGQLSHAQLTDAFRAGNFPADQVSAYVELVESRIAALNRL